MIRMELAQEMKSIREQTLTHKTGKGMHLRFGDCASNVSLTTWSKQEQRNEQKNNDHVLSCYAEDESGRTARSAIDIDIAIIVMGLVADPKARQLLGRYQRTRCFVLATSQNNEFYNTMMGSRPIAISHRCAQSSYC